MSKIRKPEGFAPVDRMAWIPGVFITHDDKVVDQASLRVSDTTRPVAQRRVMELREAAISASMIIHRLLVKGNPE